MTTPQQNRRDFIKTSAATLAAGSMPYWFTSESAMASNFKSANERPNIGCIGTGSRWNAVGPNAFQFADCVAVCDVDTAHSDAAKARVKQIQGKDVDTYDDYRKLLDRKDIDVVTVVTTDHWHSKIAIEAMQAGKDVYCEKPLTLTIKEGQQIIKTVDETKRVFQVGTQQRSEMGLRFLKAIALVKEGRLGEIKKVQCAIGGVQPSGPIPVVEVPKTLNWERWLGQAPLTEYRYQDTFRTVVDRKTGKTRQEKSRWGKTRAHYEFRWWYEYSGGKMTDWGAHHVDIATWMIGQNGPGQGPHTIQPISASHPTPMKNGMPTDPSQYNVASAFNVLCTYGNGVEMTIRSDTSNGILVEGTKGRIFVSRGSLKGKPVEDLKENPLPEDAIAKLYNGKMPAQRNAHMQNFMDCVKSRELPISDVYTHHRMLTTCHLANIAIRLDRTLKWNPKTEQIIGDKEAQSFQSREQRKGYEINVNV